MEIFGLVKSMHGVVSMSVEELNMSLTLQEGILDMKTPAPKRKMESTDMEDHSPQGPTERIETAAVEANVWRCGKTRRNHSFE